MKKSALLLVMLFAGLSITSCSADEMYGSPELSVELSNDPKDRDWDKTKFNEGGNGGNTSNP